MNGLFGIPWRGRPSPDHEARLWADIRFMNNLRAVTLGPALGASGAASRRNALPSALDYDAWYLARPGGAIATAVREAAPIPPWDAAPLPVIDAVTVCESEAPVTCSITLREFEAGEAMKQLPCGHKFEPRAIEQWMRVGKRACPVCRAPVCRGPVCGGAVCRGPVHGAA